MIYDLIGLSLERPEVISLVGAGGKTSIIKELSKELKLFNKKVLSTTSTRIFKPSDMDYFILEKFNDDFIPRHGSITYYGTYIKDGKLIVESIVEIEDIIRSNIFDYILIEADGANRKALKAPADHEPVITSLTSLTIGVIGLDSIGLILNESNVHRAQLFSSLTNKYLGQRIDADDIVNLVLDKKGLFKNSKGRKVLILNKANSSDRVKEGKNIREKLLNKDSSIDVFICNIHSKEFF